MGDQEVAREALGQLLVRWAKGMVEVLEETMLPGRRAGSSRA